MENVCVCIYIYMITTFCCAMHAMHILIGCPTLVKIVVDPLLIIVN